jgi:hypothetical protein
MTNTIVYETDWLGDEDIKPKFRIGLLGNTRLYYIEKATSTNPGYFKTISTGYKTYEIALARVSTLIEPYLDINNRKKKSTKSKSKRKTKKNIKECECK